MVVVKAGNVKQHNKNFLWRYIAQIFHRVAADLNHQRYCSEATL